MPFSALTDLVLHKANARSPMVVLLALHFFVPLVFALTLLPQTAHSLCALLTLLLSVSTVSVPRATSSVLLPSPNKMLRPAPMIQVATSFLALTAAVLALLTSADLSFHAQVVRLSAATTEAAEL
jgi:hypothetical protein